MRRLLVRLSVALLTFAVGVCAAALWLGCPVPLKAEQPAVKAEALTAAPFADPYYTGGCTVPTLERTAAHLAEEFVARNGYTDLPPDRENIAYESVERAPDLDTLLAWRRDSLERTAYGVVRPGKKSGRRWHVAFRFKGRGGDAAREWGRAVTMDRDFKNMRVEHKLFPLGNVEEKF